MQCHPDTDYTNTVPRKMPQYTKTTAKYESEVIYKQLPLLSKRFECFSYMMI